MRPAWAARSTRTWRDGTPSLARASSRHEQPASVPIDALRPGGDAWRFARHEEAAGEDAGWWSIGPPPGKGRAPVRRQRDASAVGLVEQVEASPVQPGA